MTTQINEMDLLVKEIAHGDKMISKTYYYVIRVLERKVVCREIETGLVKDLPVQFLPNFRKVGDREMTQSLINSYHKN